MTEQFIEALNDIEKNKNYDKMLALYTDSSETGNVGLTESLKGLDGAKEFWQSYRDSFNDVNSTFSNKIESGGVIALEWTTEFNREDGEDSSYRGVSLIETDGDKIKRFFAYFNPHELGEQVVEKAKSWEA